MAKDLFLGSLFDWDRDFYHFSRPEMDMAPYSIIKRENKTIIVHNVVGINKEDLKITIKSENGTKFICINGSTQDEITKQKYDVNSRFSIKAQDIANIESTMKNGLLYIEISYEKPKEETIDIKIK
jgi:HSP20 family molecular chaperone IbpA